MAEDYVRPPLVGREASPEWPAVWVLRLVGVVLLAVLVALVVLLFQVLSGAGAQDPEVGRQPAAVILPAG